MEGFVIWQKVTVTQFVMDQIVSPQNSYAEVLTSTTSEYNLTWK